jgi:hypothetical protein
MDGWGAPHPYHRTDADENEYRDDGDEHFRMNLLLQVNNLPKQTQLLAVVGLS